MTVVRVTAGHIKAGKPGKCGECPVALAVADTFPAAAFASVCPDHLAMLLDDKLVRTPTPMRAAVFIRAFDAGDPVEPFEFTVRGWPA
jgi:hypothetical protein